MSEKYGHTLPEAATVAEVARDDSIPDYLAEKAEYSGKSVVLDGGKSRKRPYLNFFTCSKADISSIVDVSWFFSRSSKKGQHSPNTSAYV